MFEHKLDSWKQFPDKVKEIRAKYGETVFGEDLNGKKLSMPNLILFRGHSDCNWQLQTTYDRAQPGLKSIVRYYGNVARIASKLQSLTSRNWNLPESESFLDYITTNHSKNNLACLPSECLSFFIYLRHHGFPSPLLDWTKSPYIAAFFAFGEKSSSERVAVYAYIEHPKGGKAFWKHDPRIVVLPQNVTTDTRHFSQKAVYTMAMAEGKENEYRMFGDHESIADQGKGRFDVLEKITIPATERQTALRELDDVNINPYTLYHSEDSLIRALAIESFVLHEFDGTDSF